MKINETVRKFLIDNSQEEYRKFSLSLLPPDTRILGVRLPLIKKYSKEICRGDWRKYLKYAQSYWYEEIMLQGFVIGSAKCEINERVDLIKGFLPKIKNWGICDSFSMGIKILEAQRPIYFKFLESCQKSGEPFIRRYATVSMLSKYVDDEYIITNPITDENLRGMRENMDDQDQIAFDKFLERNWGIKPQTIGATATEGAARARNAGPSHNIQPAADL